MAENKKGFMLYADQIHTVEKLSDVKAGKLFKHILQYVNDMNPETDDMIVGIAFEPIKQQLKRDLKRYEAKKVQWSEAGKKSAEVKKASKIQRNSTESTDVEVRSTESTVIVNGTVNVKGTVKDNTVQQQQHTHEVFAKKLFSETGGLDRQNIELQLNPRRLITETDCEEFNRHLQTEGKHHVHWSEYTKHLRNWLNTRPSNQQKTGNSFQKSGKLNTKMTAEDYLNINELAKNGISEDN
jgi:hypothetical protein